MKKWCTGVVTVVGTVLLTGVSYVLANEPKGEGPPDYSGISSIYYTLIGLIVAYGAYDSFFKKS
jgi:multisubunit Na+/H+ antiporter MnhB subunit